MTEVKISADEAIGKFRECFSGSELQYDFSNSDVNSVRCEVEYDDFRLNVWFDVQKQMWGFDMLNGGSKTSADFDEFEDYLGAYLSIYTVLIPNAKIVADAFEKELGISTVFDSFSGNRKNGYTVKFRVLGVDSQDVLVQRIPEGYLIRLVVPDDESQRYKVKTEYKYEVEDGKANPIPTMHMYIRRLKERYSNDSSKKVQRVGENMFNFCIDDLVVVAEISFNYTEVRYHVTEVGPFDADINVAPEDPYDLSVVYMACKDFYDDSVAGEEAEEEASAGVAGDSEDSGGSFQEDTVPMQETVEDSADDEAVKEVKDEECVSEGVDDQTEHGSSYTAHLDSDEAKTIVQEEAMAAEFAQRPFEDAVQDDQVPQEPVQEDVSVQDIEQWKEPVGPKDGVPPASSGHPTLYGAASLLQHEEGPSKPVSNKYAIEELQVSSIKRIDDGSGRVQFIVNGVIHIYSAEAVKAAGFPVKRIKETVKVIEKCGISMTEDEVRMRRYADEDADTEEFLSRIISAIFD